MSVFEHDKKSTGFYAILGHGATSGLSREAMGRAVGSPGAPPRGRKEFDRVIGGGLGDLSSAPPSFRKGSGGAGGRTSLFFNEFWEGKILHEPQLRPRTRLRRSRERFEEASGVKM